MLVGISRWSHWCHHWSLPVNKIFVFQKAGDKGEHGLIFFEHLGYLVVMAIQTMILLQQQRKFIAKFQISSLITQYTTRYYFLWSAFSDMAVKDGMHIINLSLGGGLARGKSGICLKWRTVILRLSLVKGSIGPCII